MTALQLIVQAGRAFLDGMGLTSLFVNFITALLFLALVAIGVRIFQR